eukprot:COSAG03_NODE_939_length_5261_cov_3.306470_3_plen_81_part_00
MGCNPFWCCSPGKKQHEQRYEEVTAPKRKTFFAEIADRILNAACVDPAATEQPPDSICNGRNTRSDQYGKRLEHICSVWP